MAPAGLSLLYSQFFVKLPVPTQSFASQTIIITGGNTGLGREAAKHIVRLGAAKVILAVRNTTKGEEAQKYIHQSTGRTGVVQVWELQLGNYASVKAFAEKVNTLSRVDAVLENAGISTNKFEMVADDESTITVNVVSTFLLALLLIPKLRETAEKFNTVPRLSIVTSSVHHFVDLKAPRKAQKILAAMSDPKAADMKSRYFDSKLLEVLYCRSLANAISRSPKKPAITLNFLNPGFCHSELYRGGTVGIKIMLKILARSTEEGSRTLVNAVEGGKDTHGEYLSDCKIAMVSHFVLSKEGKETQTRLWEELNEKLEKIEPGITGNI